MKTTGNTILITGGTSGIGLELALQLQACGNTVLVTGRDPLKLEQLRSRHPAFHCFQSDVSDPIAIRALHAEVTRAFPALNMLINNAGIMCKINLQSNGADFTELSREIETNLMGPIRMSKQFLPHLKAQASAAIVNVSSGIAFSPYPISPVYSAAKAGLHAFTTALRVQLKNTNVRVIELAPPSTDTPLNGAFNPADLKGVPMMKSSDVAKVFMKGLRSDRQEILPGMSKVLKLGSRIAPNLMVKAASGSVDAMLAQTGI